MLMEGRCAFHETQTTHAQGQKARHAARELVEQQANSNHGQALEGFGVITLASMFPILAVEVMSIGISLRYSPEVIPELAFCFCAGLC
jgi:hypothetical protein